MGKLKIRLLGIIFLHSEGTLEMLSDYATFLTVSRNGLIGKVGVTGDTPSFVLPRLGSSTPATLLRVSFSPQGCWEMG